MASLGTGVIVLIVIWALTLAILTLFTFVQSPVRWIGLVALLIAGIITLVLALLPRGEQIRTLSSSSVPTAYIGLARILILTFLCVTLIVGLVFVFLREALPAVFASTDSQAFCQMRKEIKNVFALGKGEKVRLCSIDVVSDACLSSDWWNRSSAERT